MLNIDEILNTQNSKSNFLKGLLYLAKADDKFDESEQNFFVNAALGIGLSNEEIDKLLNGTYSLTEKIDVEFESKRQALFFARESLQLCYLDGAYSENERMVIEQISSKHDIKNETLNEIEAWVKEGISWSNRGEKLIEVEG